MTTDQPEIRIPLYSLTTADKPTLVTGAEAAPMVPATPAPAAPRTRTRKPTLMLELASNLQTPTSATGAVVAVAEPTEQGTATPSTPLATRTRTDEAPEPELDGLTSNSPGSSPAVAGASSKLDRLLALLGQPGGATLAALSAATGWQAHSVRGALAGALRKKGHAVISEKTDGVRRYRLGGAS